MFSGRDEHDIRISWVQNETVRIDILQPNQGWSSAPAAAITCDIKPGSTGHKDFRVAGSMSAL